MRTLSSRRAVSSGEGSRNHASSFTGLYRAPIPGRKKDRGRKVGEREGGGEGRREGRENEKDGRGEDLGGLRSSSSCSLSWSQTCQRLGSFCCKPWKSRASSWLTRGLGAVSWPGAGTTLAAKWPTVGDRLDSSEGRLSDSGTSSSYRTTADLSSSAASRTAR